MRNRFRSMLVMLSVAGAVAATNAPAQASEPNTHDGFYLSILVGGGYLSAPGTAEGSGMGASVKFDSKISGAVLTGGLLFGGTPAPGLVLGGGTLGAYLPSPTVEVDGKEVEGEADPGSFGLLGPFVDWYLMPDQGFHLTLMPGLASFSDGEDSATGGGVMAGVGYDFWVAPEWSVGVLGRLMYGHVTLEEQVTFVTAKLTHNVWVPGLVLTATYH